MFQRHQWEKVLTSIAKKSEHEKSKEFANTIVKRYQHLEGQRAREDAKQKRAAAAAATLSANDQAKSTASAQGLKKAPPGNNISAGVKRSNDDIGKGSAPKKAALGDGKTPSTISSSTKPPTSVMVGKPSNLGDKKSALSVGGSSATASSATAKPKTPPTSSFLNRFQKGAPEASKPTAKSVFPPPPPKRRVLSCGTVSCSLTNHVTRPVEKKPAPPAPSASLGAAPAATSFTSIFDQLKQRQKLEQDREKGLLTKAADAAKAAEDEKLKKKKKSVKWRTGDDLIQVQIFEWVEPEGEYYGGGSGQEHGYGNQVGEGAALKNRDFVDDEEDFIDWYQPLRTLIPPTILCSPELI